MQIRESNISVLLLFGLFLTVTYSSLVSIYMSGWQYEPINSGFKGSIQNADYHKVLGLSIEKGQIANIEKGFKINEQNSYIYKNFLNKNILIFESTDVSEIKVENIKFIESMRIINDAKCNFKGLNLSFDNKNTWVYWSGNEWHVNSNDDVDKYMEIESLARITRPDFLQSKGFLPGITENIHFRLATSNRECTEINILARFSK